MSPNPPRVPPRDVLQVIEDYKNMAPLVEGASMELDLALALDLRDARARITALEAALGVAETALRRVEEIENSDAVQSIYTLAHAHGVRYAGPTWEKEMRAAEAALEAIRSEGDKP